MPYADSPETVHEWATERAISLWVISSGDLDPESVDTLGRGFAEARADGARLALIVPPGGEPSAAEREAVDFLVAPNPGRARFALFEALSAAGIDDVRDLGVLGASRHVLEMARRAGAGAVIGLATGGEQRRLLLDGQPDRIIDPSGFAALDRDLFASGRAHRQRVLLNPGPSVVSDRIHRAVGGPDLCHREPEYSAIFQRVREKLLRLAGVGDDWALVLLAGSGTAAMEAMTGASSQPGRKLLVCRNGTYGERIETIARRLGQEVVVVSASDLEPISPQAVAAALDADPAIDAVAVIHHETTTGLLNPVHDIARMADQRGVLTLVDAISSFGAEALEMAGTGIDFVACTANKCLHGLPGAAFVLVSPRGQERIAAVPPRSLYFDLAAYLKAQAKHTVPFTPAIPAIYGLDAALDELLDEGLEHRQAYYKARMGFLDGHFSRLGLEPRVAPANRSHSVRGLPLPSGISYDTLHDALKQEGYVIYGGLGEAARTSFRVCALGALKIEVLADFIATLERVLIRFAEPAPLKQA